MGTTLDGLTSGLNGLKGDLSTLQLDPSQVQRYLTDIESAKAGLQAQLADAQGLLSWLAGRQVGSFASATTTKQHLHEDIEEFINAIVAYVNYLDAYHAAVAAACKSIQEHG